MKRSLLLLVLIGGVWLLNACGGSSGGGPAPHIATHFFVTAPATADTGSVFSFTVTALDDIGDVASGYSGTVRFTSTDGKAVLPGNTALAGGMGMFSATLETVGSQAVTATDVAKTTITGATNSIRVATGATSFSVTAPSLATTGKAFNFTVTALDLSGNPVTNYAGTVTFTSTDGQAVLPSNSPLTSGTGSATFSLTLQTAGIQTITASDTATPLLTGTSSRIQVSAPAVGFTATGSMRSGRAEHTATLLNDGNVLVAGGFDWACPPVGPCNGFVLLIVGFAETYDTPGGIFNWPTLMNVPRVFHTATLLQDGKVLVAGGDNRFTTTYDSAEIYDPSTNSFTPTASMLSARSGHTATLLANGKVLLASGDAGNDWSATAELFDPSSQTFTATGSMSVARPWGTATLLRDGKVLFAGGKSGSPLESTATAEIYDPATGTFALTGNMNVARSEHTATLLANGKVLMAGGVDASGTVTSTAEVFDELTSVFTATGNMVTARSGQTETLLTDGKVLLTGGFDANNHDLSSRGFLGCREYGDSALRAHGHFAVKNGEVLITGGNNQDGSVPVRTLSTAELLP